MGVERMFLYVKLLFAIIDGSAAFYNICNRGEKKSKNCENIFVWSKERSNFISLFNVTLLNNYSYNSDSIRGKTVRVIADNMLPYITSSNYSETLGGFLGDVWQMIESKFGFRSNVSSIYYDTGLNMITAGEADIMLAAVVSKPGLLNVVYSQPYFYNWYHLFVKSPKARASSMSYLKTFDAELWFVTLIVFAILTMTVWLTTKFLNLVCRVEKRVSAPTCFLGIVSGFINQGFDLKLSSYSGRMQVMFALILGVVLYSAMNAVLVAQLAVFDIPFPFKSLDDIANKRTHSLCLRSNSFVYNNFTNKNREILPQWQGILNGRNCKDTILPDNLAAILCNEAVVILENRAVMDMILKNYKIPCDVINNQERLYVTGNSFLLLKSFEHKELINNIVQKMRSSGILQRLEYKWIKNEKSVAIKSPKAPQVTWDHINGILLFYSCMIIICLLVLTFEFLYFRYTHPHPNELKMFTQ